MRQNITRVWAHSARANAHVFLTEGIEKKKGSAQRKSKRKVGEEKEVRESEIVMNINVFLMTGNTKMRVSADDVVRV